MKTVAADLHIHSALSPCASDDMTPQAIVYAAVAAELDLIALCDHNCAANTEALQQAARNIAGDYLSVIAGMEITTSEEAHIIGLFPDVTSAMNASQDLAGHLPDLAADARRYGSQLLLDADGEVIGEHKHLLALGADLNLNQTVALIRRHGGLAIAAHVDRPSYSVISQLGFLPEDPVFDALEISVAGVKQGRHHEFTPLGYPLVFSSDAHYIHVIGEGRTRFHMSGASFDELGHALAGAEHRGCHGA